MNEVKATRPAWGRPLRIASALAEKVQALADETGLPFAMVAAELIEGGLENQPDWLRVKAQDHQRRQLAEVDLLRPTEQTAEPVA